MYMYRDTLKNERIIIYGVFKRKEHHNTNRPTHKFKIEISGRLLCEYSWSEYSNHTEIYKRTRKAVTNRIQGNMKKESR